MASRLSDVLSTVGIPDSARVISIHEVDTDASFIIHHSVTTELKSASAVCLVGMNQTGSHYHSIAQKFGVNLRQYSSEGSFLFVEALKSLGKQIIHNDHDGQLSEDIDIFEGLLSTKCMKHVYEKLMKKLEYLRSQEKRRVILVIDHIEVFLHLGICASEVINFVHYLKMWAAQSTGDGTICDNKVIVLTEHILGTDAEREKLLISIQHSCSHSIVVTALQTGYCKDVTGQMTIQKRRGENGLALLSYPKPLTTHFKITDRNIVCFAPGTSPAVL